MRVNPRLATLLEDGTLKGVIDHFVNLLDLPRHDLHRCASDLDTALVPRLRALNTPVAIFIDNVDEYFNKHVRAAGRASDTGEISPSIWYFAQMGLVEVAYQLRRGNHHLKVFAAVRKEAFLKFDEMTSMVQQYRGSAIDIHYTVESLREIFINNVRREKDRNLVAPDALRNNPVQAFLGHASVSNAFTHEEEDAFDYIARHTLRRPRDFMTIGQKLSDLRPQERRGRDRFKDVVSHGAGEIATEYLNEIAPYLGRVDMQRALGRISSNVLRREEVEAIFDQHNVEVAPDGEVEHIFCGASWKRSPRCPGARACASPSPPARSRCASAATNRPPSRAAPPCWWRRESSHRCGPGRSGSPRTSALSSRRWIRSFGQNRSRMGCRRAVARTAR